MEPTQSLARGARAESPARRIDPERLPPQSSEAEEGVLACFFQAPDLIERCKNLRPDTFYDLRRALIWKALRELYTKRKGIDVITVQALLQTRGELQECGGLAYLAGLPEKAPSPHNLRYYLDILLEKAALRKTIEVCYSTVAQIQNYEGELANLMQGIRADIETVTSLTLTEDKPALKVWTVEELEAWQVPEHLRLVGDNEINMGYEGIAMIAGPGSSGKSSAAASLALAGAIGAGTWMGRKVHRQFKTLIIQSENGRVRMKEEMQQMRRLHPHAPLNSHIFMSEPPEGGLPFHRGEFRVAVRRQVEALKPSLVILDTWAAAATEDSAKDVVDKLGEIRSCFPSGDDCPALLIIAHTKKPRPEELRRGRGLTFSVSGSVALPNTCRCVYMLLPWTEELEEERIYWACSKLNNGQMYPASVWRRRFGTFFDHDEDTNPQLWGVETRESEETRAIEPKDVIEAFSTERTLRKSSLAKRLEAQLGVGYSTVMRAISPGKFGYLAELIETTPEGWIRLKGTINAP